MRILHCLAQLDPASGGPARSVPQLALGLAGRGHEVSLWAPLPLSGPLADLSEEDNRKLKVLSGPFESALQDFGSPDLVHDHGIWLPCHREVAKVCRERGIPRIVSPRGMLEPWALNHKKWKKRIAWWLYQKKNLQSAAGLHATADQEADQLQQLGLRAPIVVAANGVAVPVAPDVELSRSNDELKNPGHDALTETSPIQDSKLDIQNQVRSALFLSRIHPKKGIPMLLEAWAKLLPEGWILRIVGPDEGGHVAELKALSAKLGLDWADERNLSGEPGPSHAQPANGRNVIKYAGSLEGEEKWDAFREADLFVLPTYSENFGIAVAEALATGVPVITTTGAPWEDLVARDCGWWVSPEVGAIQEALQKAISQSDDERRAMGERGRQWMKQDFGWPSIAETMEGFYEKILSGR
jgi:glycosyltransferase involved in cell wall biosynthesis